MSGSRLWILAEGQSVDVRLGSAEPIAFVLHAAFEIANAGEVFVELLAVVGAERTAEAGCFGSQRIEHAGPADELRFALLQRCGRIGAEELIEENVRAILGGDRRAAGAPGEGLIVIAAEAGAAFDAERERGKARLSADRLGEFLIARDAKAGAGAARVGAGEEGAIADVAAGVGELAGRR